MDSELNKRAWDALYKESPGLVWGTDPIPFVEEFVAGLAPGLSASSRLLDAAAGDGRHLPVLLRTPGQVFACDASANSLAKLARFDGEVRWFQCDLDGTPFGDGEFDFISLIDTIETLPEPERALAELHRILKPGGKFLCNIPGKDDEISEEEMCASEGGAPSSYLYQSTYYYRFYEEAEAIGLVEGCGFEVLENVKRHWEEGPHPGFRNYPHEHTSRVFLLGKRGF